jgi:hypothetical protein
MSIEYLEGINVGDKIKLQENNRLRPEQSLPILKNRINEQSRAYNEFYGCEFLDDDASIKMSSHPDWLKDEAISDAKEQVWASEEKKSWERWRADKEKDPAFLNELALTLGLQRCLPDSCIVVRSCRHDDYENGFDTFIADKASGAVICGIDEVIDRLGNTGPSIKEKKVRQKMLKGGAEIKYGLYFKQGEMKFDHLKHIPAVYLSLSRAELDNLCLSLKEDEPSEGEKSLFQRLLLSLSKQIESYSSLPLDNDLRSNVQICAQALSSWLK